MTILIMINPKNAVEKGIAVSPIKVSQSFKQNWLIITMLLKDHPVNSR